MFLVNQVIYVRMLLNQYLVCLLNETTAAGRSEEVDIIRLTVGAENHSNEEPQPIVIVESG
jgi:hypothetical protein